MISRMILASSSPRRKDLLAPFFHLEIVSPEIDEQQAREEKPLSYVRRMAKEKWRVVASQTESLIPILASDTVVIHRHQILGKPENEREARRFLSRLSGDEHSVVTAVALGKRSQAPDIFLVKTKVTFRSLKKKEIDDYILSDEWSAKAGAYAIQGKASAFVSKISGSLTNVIGLPLEAVLERVKAR